jgi:hypothetical protein
LNRAGRLLLGNSWQGRHYQEAKSASSTTRLSACDDQSFIPSNSTPLSHLRCFFSIASLQSKVRCVIVDWCPLSDKTFFVNFATYRGTPVLTISNASYHNGNASIRVALRYRVGVLCNPQSKAHAEHVPASFCDSGVAYFYRPGLTREPRYLAQ